MNHKTLNNLHNLNCSHNKLRKISLFDENQNLLFPKLTTLKLNHNEFTELPMELYRFPELKYLNISNNPNVTQIPRDIGYIKGI